MIVLHCLRITLPCQAVNVKVSVSREIDSAPTTTKQACELKCFKWCSYRAVHIFNLP